MYDQDYFLYFSFLNLWAENRQEDIQENDNLNYQCAITFLIVIKFDSALQVASKTNPDDQDALRAIDLLYDAALVSSGFTVSITISLLETAFWVVEKG